MNAAASILLAGAALVAGWTVATPVAAAELRIISTPAASTALKMAATDFERVAGHKVTIEYSNIAIARRRISAGEAFDVVVVSPTAIEDLVRMGTIAVGDTLNLGRTGLALFGHKGAARPDIGTEEALKRTLLSAGSSLTPTPMKAASALSRCLTAGQAEGEEDCDDRRDNAAMVHDPGSPRLRDCMGGFDRAFGWPCASRRWSMAVTGSPRRPASAGPREA